MHVITLKVPDPLFRQIEHAAAELHEPRSAIVRSALAHYLGTNAHAPGEPSSLSLVKRFVGKVEGPSDLSHNPRHFREYGA